MHFKTKAYIAGVTPVTLAEPPMPRFLICLFAYIYFYFVSLWLAGLFLFVRLLF